MLGTVNLQEVQEKIYEQLRGTGWDLKLRTEILGHSFFKILETLLKEATDNKRFVPEVKFWLNAFVKCPFDSVKVVMIGQDPYPYMGVPDGLAFSCSRTEKVEASLEYMFEAIKKTVPEEDRDPEQSPDLERWSKQGVLLLNTALTTTIGKPGSHQLLWKEFITNILDILIWNRSNDLVYVFVGKKAQEFSSFIPDSHHKFAVVHPAFASYRGLDEWDCENVFNKINEALINLKKQKIRW